MSPAKLNYLAHLTRENARDSGALHAARRLLMHLGIVGPINGTEYEAAVYAALESLPRLPSPWVDTAENALSLTRRVLAALYDRGLFTEDIRSSRFDRPELV